MKMNVSQDSLECDLMVLTQDALIVTKLDTHGLNQISILVSNTNDDNNNSSNY